MTDSDKTLHIGICMAGAISAGAYTAGVMDYLIEALERWEAAKRTWPEKVPHHQLVIDTLTGASAGGMTAAIAAAALQTKFDPVTAASITDEAVTKGNKFYDAWVNLSGDPDMLIPMLANDDIDHTRLASLLNGRFIDEIAGRLINVAPDAAFYHRPYIAEKLELWLSLSNLTGFPIKIEFNRDDVQPDNYISYNHRDFAHFAIYRQQTESLLHEIPVNFKDPGDAGKMILAQAAMATGAFPVGLPARTVKRPRSFFINNTIYEEFLHFKIDPDDLPPPDEKGYVHHLFVDGGMLNNEPFDVTDYILGKRAPDKNGEWHHTILMIDPFPSMASGRPPHPDLDPQLTALFGKLLTVLIQQPLVKTADLERALDRLDYRRFLVAPRRTVPVAGGSQAKNGGAAIACGSLGGFGGFLARGFREHDFLLGRYNCQRFLQRHFSVKSEDDNVVSRGYDTELLRHLFSLQPDTDDPQLFLPILPDIDPLTGEKMAPTDLPAWPVDAPYREGNLQLIAPVLKTRIKGIAGKVLPGGALKFLFDLLAVGRLSQRVLDLVDEQLAKHHLSG